MHFTQGQPGIRSVFLGGAQLTAPAASPIREMTGGASFRPSPRTLDCSLVVQSGKFITASKTGRSPLRRLIRLENESLLVLERRVERQLMRVGGGARRTDPARDLVVRQPP